MSRRERVRRRLFRIRHRLARLVRAEKNRDEVTRKRRTEYLRLRKAHGDDDARTRKALKAYRASRKLSERIDHTEKGATPAGGREAQVAARQPAAVGPGRRRADRDRRETGRRRRRQRGAPGPQGGPVEGPGGVGVPHPGVLDIFVHEHVRGSRSAPAAAPAAHPATP